MHGTRVLKVVSHPPDLPALLMLCFDDIVHGVAKRLDKAVLTAVCIPALKGFPSVEVVSYHEPTTVDLVEHLVRVLNEIFEVFEPGNRESVGPDHNTWMMVEAKDSLQTWEILSNVVEHSGSIVEGICLGDDMEQVKLVDPKTHRIFDDLLDILDVHAIDDDVYICDDPRISDGSQD